MSRTHTEARAAFMREAIEYNDRKFNMREWNLFMEFSTVPAPWTKEQLAKAIMSFQEFEGTLLIDGKCGPMTYRRILAHTSAQDEVNEHEFVQKGSILYNGELIPVPFKAIPPTGNGGMSLIKHKDYNAGRKDPTQVVWHWDACLNAKTCHRVLAGRNVSSHGCIDNDGTFYQFLDFRLHRAWHAGHSRVNRTSVGIDISNAVYKKYQPWYMKRFGYRPEISVVVHGRGHEILGYYPAQIETAKGIAKFLESHAGIPLEHPGSNTVISAPQKFKGHLAHYNIKKSKWDVAGFPFDYITGKVTK